MTPRTDGNWNVKREGANRPSAVTTTQHQAQQQATSWLKKNPAGGEVRIQGLNGKFRDSNTINRKDPFPPRG